MPSITGLNKGKTANVTFSPPDADHLAVLYLDGSSVSATDAVGNYSFTVTADHELTTDCSPANPDSPNLVTVEWNPCPSGTMTVAIV